MLLPKKEEEEQEQEDPRAELVQQLLEYKMYKCMAYELRDRQMDAEQVFFKEPTIPPEVAEYEEPVDLAELVGDMNLAKLDQIFKSIMKKQVDKIDPVRSKFGKIEKEEVHFRIRCYMWRTSAKHTEISASATFWKRRRARWK